ncbi:LamG domain-containing protein [Terrimonas rubra]|uniref:LamG domain-containing protein n=1 Tax=Terrimonas rubra TaxID=1035890 RepID=A0ABW6A183_9BACT
MKNILNKFFPAITVSALLLAGCQKMSKPDLGEYPEDANPPGGPLSFYVAFDGTTDNNLKNAVDSIRANYPSDNPLTSVDGISGKAIKGETAKYVKYIKPNDWAITAKSFTVSSWFKRDGQTKNNENGNGPEYILSFRAANDYNWSNGNFLFFLEGNNAACGVKLYIQSKNGDGWLTWEGGQMIAGLLDNKWHHIAAVYNAPTSTMTLYIDGVANPNTKVWGTHGDLNLDDEKIAEVRIGRGPRNDSEADGAAGWLQSSFKGEIDQVRLYSTALTAAEVQSLFVNKK